MRYYPFGETRLITGSVPTDRRYTGQRQESVGLGSLYDYGARMYSPVLGRFISSDTIVPGAGNPQAFNRYPYVNNRPLNFTDPTGNFSEDEIKKFFDKENWEEVLKLFQKGGLLEGRWGWLSILQKAQTGDFVTVEWNKDMPLPQGHPSFGDKLAGEFQIDHEKLIIMGKDYFIDQMKAALYGKEFGLEHKESGIGERLSYWSASAKDRSLKWINSKTDFVGRFGPTPGRHIDPLGKALTVGYTMAVAGELYAMGAETISAAPAAGPAAPVVVGISVIELVVAIGLTIVAVNTTSAP